MRFQSLFFLFVLVLALDPAAAKPPPEESDATTTPKPGEPSPPLDLPPPGDEDENEVEDAAATTTTTESVETTKKPKKELTTAAAVTTTTSPTTTTPVPAHLEGRSRVCDLFAGIDEPLWNQYDRNMSALTQMVEGHVEFANGVFGKQVFTKDEGYGDVYFRLKHIQVMFGSCEGLEGLEDKNCTEIREEYLHSFDRYDFSDYCLAFMFTHRDFHNGTAGLASIGTVCMDKQNSGFVTLLNYNRTRSQQESWLTFAHELGHSFGAKHDVDAEDEECAGKGFVMAEVFEEGKNKENRDKFSPCSLASFKRKLVEVEDYPCFRSGVPYGSTSEEDAVTNSLCGNGVVEVGEECDCGSEYKDCDDQCCYAAHIDPADRERNLTAMPCTVDVNRPYCLRSPALVYGVYAPWIFMLCACVAAGCGLAWDWRNRKTAFKHIVYGNVRIVSGASSRRGP